MMRYLFGLCVLTLFVAACSSPETNAPDVLEVAAPAVDSIGGGDKKCTITQDGSVSTMYLSNGKVVRADFVHPTQGKAHILYQGDLVYQWIDGASQGMKFSLSQMQQMNARMQSMVASLEAEQGPSVVASAPSGPRSDCRFFSIGADLLRLPLGVNFVSPPTVAQIQNVGSQAEAEALVAQLREQYGQ